MNEKQEQLLERLDEAAAKGLLDGPDCEDARKLRQELRAETRRPARERRAMALLRKLNPRIEDLPRVEFVLPDEPSSPTDCLVAAPTGRELVSIRESDRVVVYTMPQYQHWSRYGFAPFEVVKQFPKFESHAIHVGPSGVFTDIFTIFGESAIHATTDATGLPGILARLDRTDAVTALRRLADGEGKVARFIDHGMLRGPANEVLRAIWFAQIRDRNAPLAQKLWLTLGEGQRHPDQVLAETPTWIPRWEREPQSATPKAEVA